MRAKDLMHTDALTVREDDTVDNLLDVLVGEHLHGAPVLSATGELVGVVSQQDVFFGTMMRGRGDGNGPHRVSPQTLRVRDIMTSPAVSADEQTDVPALCKMMYKLRIHRIPIVGNGKVIGIISSLDVCAAVANGDELK